jgi:ribosomal protein L19E
VTRLERLVCTASTPQDIGGGRLAVPGEPVDAEVTPEVRELIHAGLMARAPKTSSSDTRASARKEERRDG